MPEPRPPRRPLDLKESFGLSHDALETLEFIEAFDFKGDEQYTRVEKRLLHAGATREFKRFLALPVVYPGQQDLPFVPSLPLDKLWHAFILNTPRYRAFCERVYGQYLDHVPGPSRKATEGIVFGGPMQFTVEKVLGTFDNVNKRYWKKITYCGPCLVF